ncbi:MAG: hypothetical protein NT077_01460, partial [Candidatus Taylorbacteria bacterium]|nr:hypothetical protein [Candidatus Taylorbacteria bacterium]
MKQIEIHNKIDSFFKREVNSASTKVAYDLIMHNTDAKRYFFSIANEAWIKWLWAKDFFSELKKPSKDTTVYSYRLPELEYLTRMVEKDPQTVSDIINSVSISKTTFNPEVVDRFFWITGLLPVQYIKMILPKILTENWVQLMSPFNRSGYEYKKIAEKVIEAKDWDALIILAKIILTIRTREELDAMEKFSIADKLFYLH